METRVCSTCKLEKNIDKFGIDRRRNQIKCRCKKCCSDASAIWNRKHPENNRKAHERYTIHHPDLENKRMRIWRKEHPDKNNLALEKARIYKRTHRKQINANNKRWVQNNPEKVKRTRENWKTNHPGKYTEKAKQDWQKRRAAKLNAPGSGVLPEEWNRIVTKFNGKCIGPGPHGGTLSMDHIVPLSRGGADTANNIQPLCRVCNSRKGTRTIDYRKE